MSQQLDQMLTDATARISALPKLSKHSSIASSSPVTNVPSNAASSFPACRACLRSIASPLTITSRAYSSDPHPSSARSRLPARTAPACVSSAIPRRQNVPGQDHRLARLSGQPARAIHYPMDMPQPSPGFSGGSFPDSQTQIYTEPSLLVVDELGYLSLDQQTSNLFYQVISTRHSSKRSTLITTNTAFSDWATSSTTPPSLLPSPIAWWKTRDLSPRRRKPSQRQ